MNMILVARDYQELGIPRLVVNTIDPDPVSMQLPRSERNLTFILYSIHARIKTPRTSPTKHSSTSRQKENLDGQHCSRINMGALQSICAGDRSTSKFELIEVGAGNVTGKLGKCISPNCVSSAPMQLSIQADMWNKTSTVTDGEGQCAFFLCPAGSGRRARIYRSVHPLQLTGLLIEV